MGKANLEQEVTLKTKLVVSVPSDGIEIKDGAAVITMRVTGAELSVVDDNPQDLTELLAEYAHNAWIGWMKYLFLKSTENEDGTVTIPKWAVDRWRRQMHTLYNGLPEHEKESDRVEALKILSIVGLHERGGHHGRQVHKDN